jgi:SAM-dependent methyltransferase
MTASPAAPVPVCPHCHGALTIDAGGATCSGCRTSIPRHGELLDFRGPAADERGWADRQRLMTSWYEELHADPQAEARCYDADYEPLRELLQAVTGRVLDLGGGSGVARGYLRDDVVYVNLEPSPEWPAPAAGAFVLGVGEQLPFADGSFDAVLSLWSLNHAADPAAVVAEARRVLRPGGRLIMVLEDMRPRWSDLAQAPFGDGSRPRARSVVKRMLAGLGLRPWPLQPDHTRLRERDLLRWLDGAAIESRAWRGRYLTFDVMSPAASSARQTRG